MHEQTTTHGHHGKQRTRESWLQLRGAIAEEYISKLPELMTIGEFARFSGMTIAQVRHATSVGDLVVSLREGRRGIAPADNLPFLLRERLLRLPTPQGRGRRRNRSRSLPVSQAAYERVWDEAVRHATSPREALDRLLLAQAVDRFREPAAGLEPATARLQGECSTN